jgi:hypothetical protein
VATARGWRELVGKWNHNPRPVTRRDSRAQGEGGFASGVPPSWNESARDQTTKLPVLRHVTYLLVGSITEMNYLSHWSMCCRHQRHAMM